MTSSEGLEMTLPPPCHSERAAQARNLNIESPIHKFIIDPASSLKGRGSSNFSAFISHRNVVDQMKNLRRIK
tara:strand:+ start:145 stop:360 length:216 start_codon:yes stop_codon:yes gene_type:complete